MSKQVPSEREMEILKVMWNLGEAKVREIHEAVSCDRPCAFTTIQTVVRIMSDKGFVKKRSERRADFYTPVYSTENATSRFLEKVFDGAIDKFMLSMLSSQDISADELKQLERMIAKARRKKEKESKVEES